MIRLFACLFGWNWAVPAVEIAERDDPLRSDALGEYLRGSGNADVTPEVLLRIL